MGRLMQEARSQVKAGTLLGAHGARGLGSQGPGAGPRARAGKRSGNYRLDMAEEASPWQEGGPGVGEHPAAAPPQWGG